MKKLKIPKISNDTWAIIIGIFIVLVIIWKIIVSIYTGEPLF